jgi:hypothetical protein
MGVRWSRFYKSPAKYLELKSIKFANSNLNMPDNERDFLQAISGLADQKIVLFYHLITRALVCDVPISNWLKNWFNNMATELSIIGYDELANSSWLTMPLLTTAVDKGYLTWLYIGIHPQQNNDNEINYIELNGASFFAKSARDEIRATWNYWKATNCHQHSLSILYYSRNNIQVSGHSLGLPLALALAFLNSGQAWPKGLFATGALQNDKVTKVEGLSAKYESIRHQFNNTRHIFIYPKETLPSVNFQKNICYSVNTLSQAREYSAWFTNDIGGDFDLYKKCLSSPELFCDNIRSLPLGLVEYVICNEQTPLSLDLAQNDYQSWKKIVETLDEIRKENDKGWYFLHIFSIDDVLKLANKDKSYARQCFKWAALAVSVANHKGQTKEATSWYDLAITLEEYASSRDIASLLNRHGLINARHNYYDFRPELPPQFLKVFSRRKSRYETGDDDYALASLYGSKSQNFGFCGPQFLKDTIEASNNAINIFTEPEDVCRQYNYQAYAYLDAKEFQNAWLAMSRYLELSPRETINNFLKKTKLGCGLTYGILPKHDTKYVLALLCRIMAETISSEDYCTFWKYFKPVLTEIFSESLYCHPYQLILANLGSIAWKEHEYNTAQKAWQKSIDVCLASGNTTIEPMALLSMSHLYKHNLLKEEKKSKVEELLTQIQTSSQKIRTHFAPILEQPIETVLCEIIDNQQQFFPFSYR